MHAPSDGSEESDRHRRSEKHGDQMNIDHAWCDLKLGVSDIVLLRKCIEVP